MKNIVEELVKIHGEQHRRLIEDSLEWLNEKEKVWGVSVNINKFVRGLISKAVRVKS